ncbi:hypothetical protein V5E97_06215 [Singulisphaera sp. Ch08]|uniref:Chemotaxis methyl-accepting receptor HlyB-like 4HB MCP domain-containing protein n=1 Tax=Singulisphaera sp. Ch08 TaxID=3120278 RepID=A0AAU7CKK4_9BACT
MRLPRVRLTVRQMMAGVAALAVMLGSVLQWRWHQLSREYSATAKHFAEMEAGERYAMAITEANLAEFKKELQGLDPKSQKTLLVKRQIAEEAKYLDFMKANARHSSAVRAIHEQAASRPWLPLAPEPPMP